MLAVLAAVDGLARLKKMFRGSHRQELIGVATVAVLLSSLAVSAWGRFGSGPLWFWRHPYYTTAVDRVDAATIVEQVPAGASVAAQNHLLPHLSNRREIYQINRPILAEFVVLDLLQSAWPYQRKYARNLGRDLLGQGYGVVACLGSAILLRRGAESIDCPALGVRALGPDSPESIEP